MLSYLVNKNILIKQYEDTVRKHFENLPYNIPIVIPYFDDVVENAFTSGTVLARPPLFNRMDISFEDWQLYLKKQEYNKDFKNILKND